MVTFILITNSLIATAEWPMTNLRAKEAERAA